MTEKNHKPDESAEGSQSGGDFGSRLAKMSVEHSRAVLDVRAVVGKLIFDREKARQQEQARLAEQAKIEEQRTKEQEAGKVADSKKPAVNDGRIPSYNLNSIDELPQEFRGRDKSILILIQGGPGKKSTSPDLYEGEYGQLRRLYDEVMEEDFGNLESHPEFKGEYMPISVLRGFKRNNVCWAGHNVALLRDKYDVGRHGDIIPRVRSDIELLEQRHEDMDPRLDAVMLFTDFSQVGNNIDPMGRSLIETIKDYKGHRALLLAPVEVDRKWAPIYLMGGLQSLMIRLFEKKTNHEATLIANYKVGLACFLAADYITGGRYRNDVQAYMDLYGIRTTEEAVNFLVKSSREQIRAMDEFVGGYDPAHSRERYFRDHANAMAILVQTFYADKDVKYSPNPPAPMLKAYSKFMMSRERV